MVIGKTSGRGNPVTIESNIRNEGVRKPKRDTKVDSKIKPKENAKVGFEVQPMKNAKVGYKVQPIIATMTPVFHWFITITVLQSITTITAPVFY